MNENDAEGHILHEIKSGEMANRRYSVVVRPYMLGQHRIQLTDVTVPTLGAPTGHGMIVRELCTYQALRAALTVTELQTSADPERYCRSLETVYNCEGPGMRIRLDNTEEEVRFPMWRDKDHRPGE